VVSRVHEVHRGVNWIDTAAIYGLGHSEEVVGTRLDAALGIRAARTST
jgi:aryl-alcohol dehydrogenase-like predicted oxidoreductase